MISRSLLLILLSFSLYAKISEEFKLKHCAPLSGSGPILSYQNGHDSYSMQKIAQSSYVLYNWNTESVKSEVLERIPHVSDFLIKDNLLWVLNGGSLSKFDLESLKLIKVYPIPGATSPRFRARGMDIYQNKIYIAQGILGVRGFYLDLEEFSELYPMYTKNKDGKFSEITDLTFDRDLMYMSLSTATPSAFTGVVSFDMKTNKIDHLGAYNVPKIGVLGPSSKIYIHDSQIVLNNEGWVHTISIDRFNRKKRMTPQWLAHSSEYNGETIYSLIRGDLVFDGNKVLGCDQKKVVDRKSRKRSINKVFVEINLNEL